MPDKSLTCIQCHQPFEFTEGEQRFFAQKGFTEPKRCSPCRKAKREQKKREEEEQAPKYQSPE